ncbi:DNA-3-methyladenine glycosylase [Bifidobacterium xylocopae]|uniref:DNA-3-methyladenine glycosylase n=1 Tax=Bifidobacterium xylocopae TaxID=2493119 RepID=UPI001F022578|nr:DNA-3-methyladenine glycosylase [Bifidobacterium xylocopae]
MRFPAHTGTSTFPDFLDGPVDEAAQRLLGCLLVRDYEDGGQATVRIVETEAYDQEDPASHAYHGLSERNRAMFGPFGHLYVYFTYGMHYCCNIVCEADGFGAGVLIRAAEPMAGADILSAHRHGTHAIRDLTNGPAKLCQALAIDKTLYGHDLRLPPLRLVAAPLEPGEHIESTPRIGISKAKQRLRRYIINDNPFVSR